MPHTLNDLATLEPDTLRIVPLGGHGEVGRNMTVFEINGKILIIDCGVLFPEDTQPGVDLILPDIEQLQDRLDDIEAIVLTHGHEDHIGGVPYLLRMRPDIPILGSKLTLALIEAKLKEHRIKPYTLTVVEGDTEQIGPFECSFIAVNHSIPDALAVHVRCKAGTLLHTGDFKMDQLPLDHRLTDLRAFARVGEEGLDLFMVDSTNAEVPGFTPAEKHIGPVISDVIRRTEGKVVVASFSSHVHRVQQVIDAAAENGRRVALIGRSMLRNMTIASQLGFLNVPDGILIDHKSAGKLPDDEIVYMCTGSQGEPMAVLSRMANGNHAVEVGEQDTIILASSLIPGNENSVFRVINGLIKLGCNVVHKANAKVHVSGHAAAGELRYCYNIVQPKYVMPVHGEYRHLIANAAVAGETGVPEHHQLVTENGGVVEMRNGEARIVDHIDIGFVYVDGTAVGTVTDDDLRDRRTLAEEGFISIYAVFDARRGTLIAGPDIHARGFAPDDEVFNQIRPQVERGLREALEEGTRDIYRLSQIVRRTVGRWVATKHRRRPMIVPIVVEASAQG